MIKKNKIKVIISSIIILLPMLFGIIMWNQLPDAIATHFGISGEADVFSAKAFAVFGIPTILLVLHFIALLVTSFDKGNKDQTPKALGIIFWIIPMISLFVNIIIYGVALEKDTDLSILIPTLLGVLFVVMGNYMPKVKQNSTLGIKVLWALRNTENWNKTHRFGGKLMVASGLIMIISSLLPIEASIIILVSVIILFAIITTVYSYLIYKKHQKDGIEYAPRTKSQGEKVFSGIAAVVIPIILLGIALIMFTGNIEVECEDTSFNISASYWRDIDVNYADIDSIEYRTELDVGIKANGFNSARLMTGVFKNKEFGSYTIYAYTSAKEFAVLTSGDKILVIGMSDAKDTKAIYNTISEKLYFILGREDS